MDIITSFVFFPILLAGVSEVEIGNDLAKQMPFGWFSPANPLFSFLSCGTTSSYELWVMCNRDILLIGFYDVSNHL